MPLIQLFYATLIILPTALGTTGTYDVALDRAREASMIASGAKATIDKAMALVDQEVKGFIHRSGMEKVVAVGVYVGTSIQRQTVTLPIPLTAIKAVSTMRISTSGFTLDTTWNI